jgi:hypothetical protein
MEELSPLALIAGLEKDLTLPPGFVANLVKEDDWSFIIKSHALLEASLSHLITSVIGRQELRPIFARLETSDNRRGKIAFVEALGLLGSTDRRFIQKLSELRNLLVHNVSMVGFSLPSYVASLDPNQFTSFVNSFGFVLDGKTLDVGGQALDSRQLCRLYPRVVIWTALFTVCGRIILQKTLAAIQESFVFNALIHSMQRASDA